jgi:hypothetical protein
MDRREIRRLHTNCSNSHLLRKWVVSRPGNFTAGPSQNRDTVKGICPSSVCKNNGSKLHLIK